MIMHNNYSRSTVDANYNSGVLGGIGGIAEGRKPGVNENTKAKRTRCQIDDMCMMNDDAVEYFPSHRTKVTRMWSEGQAYMALTLT